MNKVILIGNLTANPEMRMTTNGIPVATFTLAINRTFTNASGEREADFIRCVTYRKQAENIGRFLSKGSKVAVEGRIQTGSYTAQDGSKRYTTDVVCDNVQFLDTRNSGGQESSFNQNQNQNQGFNSYNQNQYQPNNYNRGGYNNSNNNANQNYSSSKEDDFFDNNINVDISEDDLPF